MLAIRLQRRGRKGLAHYRIIVQDSHEHPKNGKIVSYLGSYDPHTKKVELDKEETDKFLKDGAQPSNSVAILLEKEKVKLPDWVVIDRTKKKAPKAEKEESEEEAPAEGEEGGGEAQEDKPAEDVKEKAKEEKSEEKSDDKPEEESKDEPKEEKADEKPEESKEEPKKEEKTE